jgi:hypothetical protein
MQLHIISMNGSKNLITIIIKGGEVVEDKNSFTFQFI